MSKRVIIMGAAGRDFHNFLRFYKDNKHYKVIAFTANQIPDISHRKFPARLAGKAYPKGIPIYPEEDLTKLIKKHKIDEVVLSYSDLNYTTVMHKAALILAAGANFNILSHNYTQIRSKKKLISVCAVRTGCGKSQVSRKIARLLRKAGKSVIIIRHPMPYGNIKKQRVQRFEHYKDFAKAFCTIEEREEYEKYIAEGFVVYAGVDYEAILKQAEKEADIILWDGGNNDVPFYTPDLHIVVLDPYRAGHELNYHAGEENFRLADAFIINKMDSAPKSGVKQLITNIKLLEKETKRKRTLIKANSAIKLEKDIPLKGKRVLVIEDGPTLTHGEMDIGAAEVLARRKKAKVISPKKYALASIKAVYKKYPHISRVLPAMGYSTKQIKHLEKTIDKVPCDYVLNGSPADLSKLLKVKKPIINVLYELEEIAKPDLKSLLRKHKFI